MYGYVESVRTCAVNSWRDVVIPIHDHVVAFQSSDQLCKIGE